MIYQGTVHHNGHIVLDLGARLAEGTKVEVSPVSSPPPPKRGSYEAIAPFIGVWEDQAEDMDRSLAELRKMKEEEVRRQRNEPEPQL